jgi:hypothetical protein
MIVGSPSITRFAQQQMLRTFAHVEGYGPTSLQAGCSIVLRMKWASNLLWFRKDEMRRMHPNLAIPMPLNH